jgi:hypothetical protein
METLLRKLLDDALAVAGVVHCRLDRTAEASLFVKFEAAAISLQAPKVPRHRQKRCDLVHMSGDFVFGRPAPRGEPLQNSRPKDDTTAANRTIAITISTTLSNAIMKPFSL